MHQRITKFNKIIAILKIYLLKNYENFEYLMNKKCYHILKVINN